MAQTIATASVSRINRRFLLLAIVLAILSAVLVYAQMSRSGKSGGGSAGDVEVVVANAAIPAGTRITADMVSTRQFTADDVGFQALADPQQAVGQVIRYPIAAGEQILSSKLVDTSVSQSTNLAYVLEDGTRGVSFKIQQVNSAGGLVLPGDHVDLVWLPAAGGPAFVLLSDIEVTAVAQTVLDVVPAAPGLQTDPSAPQSGGRTRVAEAEPQPEAATVTVMITPEQALTLLCAASVANMHGGEVDLAVRSFGDTSPLAVNAPVCPPVDLLRQLGVTQGVTQ